MRRRALFGMVFLVAGMGLKANAGSTACPAAQQPEEHPIVRLRYPRLIHKVRPDYPEPALRQGIKEASVFVQFVIDRRGRVKNPRILKCTHAEIGFEGAALIAVKRWRYEPAEMNGDALEVYQTVEVKFDAATSSP